MKLPKDAIRKIQNKEPLVGIGANVIFSYWVPTKDNSTYLTYPYSVWEITIKGPMPNDTFHSIDSVCEKITTAIKKKYHEVKKRMEVKYGKEST